MAAARAAPSFNTAAYGLAECDCGTAPSSAASPHATADAYGLAAPNCSPAPESVALIGITKARW